MTIEIEEQIKKQDEKIKALSVSMEDNNAYQFALLEKKEMVARKNMMLFANENAQLKQTITTLELQLAEAREALEKCVRELCSNKCPAVDPNNRPHHEDCQAAYRILSTLPNTAQAEAIQRLLKAVEACVNYDAEHFDRLIHPIDIEMEQAFYALQALQPSGVNLEEIE